MGDAARLGFHYCEPPPEAPFVSLEPVPELVPAGLVAAPEFVIELLFVLALSLPVIVPPLVPPPPELELPLHPAIASTEAAAATHISTFSAGFFFVMIIDPSIVSFVNPALTECYQGPFAH